LRSREIPLCENPRRRSESKRVSKPVELKARAVLFVGEPCVSCDEAVQLWREVAHDLGVRIDVKTIDISTHAAQAGDATVTALPTLLVDGAPVIVGVPESDSARALLRQALDLD